MIEFSLPIGYEVVLQCSELVEAVYSNEDCRQKSEEFYSLEHSSFMHVNGIIKTPKAVNRGINRVYCTSSKLKKVCHKLC